MAWTLASLSQPSFAFPFLSISSSVKKLVHGLPKPRNFTHGLSSVPGIYMN